MKQLLLFLFLLPTFCLKSQERDSFIDPHDGEVYATVKIGNQIWMAENLRYKAPGYFMSGSGSKKYGCLYTWAQVMGLKKKYNDKQWKKGRDNNRRGICPSGWHLPSDAEWDVLIKYLGADAGIKLKSQSGWRNADNPEDDGNGEGNGTNSSGFNAIPGGIANSHSQAYNGILDYTCFWSSTACGAGLALGRELSTTDTKMNRTENIKSFGLSCRCIKD